MEEFLKNPVQLGVGGLLSMFILSVITGLMVPRKVMEDRMTDMKAIIDFQAKTIDNLTQAVENQKAVTALQVESAKTVEQLVRALPEAMARKEVT